MIETYNIPLKYKKGIYLAAELPAESECIVIEHDDYDILTYSLPVSGNEIRKYSLSHEEVRKTLSAVYGDDGRLLHIYAKCNNSEQLVYIGFEDNESAKTILRNFCNQQGEILCKKIAQYKGKVSRLFIETFYDGESVDFAVKIASPQDVGTVISNYGIDAADNSGNYSSSGRIQCDCDTWAAMLQCAPPDLDDAYESGVAIMKSIVEKNALDALDKTADFKFVYSEYD